MFNVYDVGVIKWYKGNGTRLKFVVKDPVTPTSGRVS